MIPYYNFAEINLGLFTVPVYPLMHGLAYALGGILILAEAARKGLNHDKIFKAIVLGIIGAFVGARLGGVIRYWDYFSSNPQDIFNLGIGGWTESGGFIVSFLFVLLYVKYSHLPLKDTLDVAAPGMAARFAVSRLGCGAIHDHLGKVMAYPWPWGINYFGEVRHETGLYSLVSNTLIFIVLWNLRKKIKTPGFLFVLYLLLYSVSVFIIRFFRAEDLPFVSDPRYFGFTATQYIVIGVFIVALILLKKFNNERQNAIM